MFLYPLKFRPILKKRIWGGLNLEQKYGKKGRGEEVGESWEISSLQDDVSVVAGGPLKGNTLQELIEVYLGEMVGERVYERYGHEFPLLVKLIDAADHLSLQVHPGDELAEERHNAYGKTEMWYVMDADPDAYIYLGFKVKPSKEEYVRHVGDKTLTKILNKIHVKKGDAFIIPAGTVHAIGKGVTVAEIQQSSDITYRVYDWDRIDTTGKGRELHIDLALEAIDYTCEPAFDITRRAAADQAVMLTGCPYFVVNLVHVATRMERNYYEKESFVVLLCVEGRVEIKWDGGSEALHMGETVLIPAALESVELSGGGKLLETYIPEEV